MGALLGVELHPYKCKLVLSRDAASTKTAHNLRASYEAQLRYTLGPASPVRRLGASVGLRSRFSARPGAGRIPDVLRIAP